VRARGGTAVRPVLSAVTDLTDGDLHPEDFRALGMAKLDDGADANARIPAMIALWRHNDR
jgi:hypothetical protein